MKPRTKITCFVGKNALYEATDVIDIYILYNVSLFFCMSKLHLWVRGLRTTVFRYTHLVLGELILI